jgi:hypothetical protein
MQENEPKAAAASSSSVTTFSYQKTEADENDVTATVTRERKVVGMCYIRHILTQITHHTLLFHL